MSLNPLDGGIPLSGYLPTGTDDDEKETWEKPGWFARRKRGIQRKPHIWGALLLIFIGLAIFFAPALPTAHIDPLYILVIGLIGSHIFVYLKGRQSGLAVWKDLDIKAVHKGDSAEFAIGRKRDIGSGVGFTPLKSISKYGFNKEFLSLSDWFGYEEVKDHKNKYQRVSEDGSDALKDRLPRTTTIQKDNEENGNNFFNSIIVSHAGSRRDDLHSKSTDREYSTPPMFDRRVSSAIRLHIGDSALENRELRRQMDTMEQSVQQLETMVDERAKPHLEDLASILKSFNLIDGGRGANNEQLEIDVSGVDEQVGDDDE